MNTIRKSAAIFSALVTSVATISLSVSNLWNARRHCSPDAVACEFQRRYPFYYAINAEFPPFDLTGYTDSLIEGVPFIRMSAKQLRRAFSNWPVDSVAFRTQGVVLVIGAVPLRVPTAAATVKNIKRTGWRIVTVGDARRIIDWFELKTESDANDYIGIGELLVPICKEVVATRAAIMIAHTPAFPKPFKLCKLSLNGVMRARPPDD